MLYQLSYSNNIEVSLEYIVSQVAGCKNQYITENQ